MVTYITEVDKRYISGRVISVVNLTPDFSDSEKNSIKKEIEPKLYEVFSKYMIEHKLD